MPRKTGKRSTLQATQRKTPTPGYAPPRGGYTQLTWKELTEQGHVIAGSPETVRQRIEDLAKKLNVGNLFCLMHVGNMPADKCMYSTKLFAEKVMPKLRNMFPDWDHDNRFWTSPLPKRVTSGSMPKDGGKYNLYAAIVVKKVDAKTRSTTSLNDLLRY